MKTVIATAVILVVAGAATAHARVDFNVHIDVPAIVAPMPPALPAVYLPVPPAGTVQTQMVLVDAPRFIYSPNLGFHVSVGAPYDMVYLNHGYYLYREGYWHTAPAYQGPWSTVSHRRLPPELRKHRYEQIRHYRDRDHYRGTWHRPGDHRGMESRDGRRDGRVDYRWDGRGRSGRDYQDHRDARRGWMLERH